MIFACVCPRSFTELLVGAPGDLLLERADTVEHQVLMTIDESGEEGRRTEVHGRRPRHVGTDGFDVATDECDPGRLDDVVTVEQQPTLDDAS